MDHELYEEVSEDRKGRGYMLKLMSWTARPVYKRLLIAAVVIYVLGSTIVILDLCVSVSKMEHMMLDIVGFRQWEK